MFDEKRVFTPGAMPGPVVLDGVRIGIPICEDIWGADIVECLTETHGLRSPFFTGAPAQGAVTEHMDAPA